MIKLDYDRKEAIINDKRVLLTKHEFELLNLFINNPNKLYSRQELISKLWTSKVNLRTVDATISRLRKKLNGSYIITRSGYGYGLMIDNLK